MEAPDPVAAVVDHENNTVTVALTLRWNPEWSSDKCEVISTLGIMGFALIEAFADVDKVAGFSYSCYDPHEEQDLGYIADYTRPVCAGCGKPVRHVDPERDRWRAPEGYEHVDPIPVVDGHAVCDRLSGRSDAQYVVRFPNLLDVDLGRHRERTTT